jgi:paraquat-inducible protein A
MPVAETTGKPRCGRCGTPIRHGTSRGNRPAAVCSAAALALYVPAMLLPMLRVSQLGQVSEDSLLSGVISLLKEGYWFVGLVVLVFSVILPPVKLIALWVLSSTRVLSSGEHHALMYRLVEQLGKWGMLDVLLVAVLVAFIKLGDVVAIQAGPAIVVFSTMVMFSLLASVFFDPHAMWTQPPIGPA